MKKTVFFACGALAASLLFSACQKEEKDGALPEGTADVTIDYDDFDVTSENIGNLTAYALQAATLLEADAKALDEAWSVSFNDGEAYAVSFKNPGNGKLFTSYANCAEQIVSGCADIANEVGTSKIGSPRSLWENGSYKEAVYAVESWYSFHSIDDYTNNIYSIRNAFNGSVNGNEANASLASYLKANKADLYNEVKVAINDAASAIQGINAPFRSHIGSSTVITAMDACSALETVLTNQLKPYVMTIAEADLKPIVETYTNEVVLPTYESLAKKNADLKSAVEALKASPSDATFEAAAEAWLNARQPWETSEAFLFGPVDELGLDPNMDSWPLDVDAIKNILATGDFSQMNWDDTQSAEAIEASQSVRGFHTLEFLLFKNGEPRTYTAE